MNAMEGLEMGSEEKQKSSEAVLQPVDTLETVAQAVGVEHEHPVKAEVEADGVAAKDRKTEEEKGGKKEMKSVKIKSSPTEKKVLHVILHISSERLGRVVRNPNPKPLRIHRGGWPKGVKRSKTGEAMTLEESAAARAAQELAAAAAAAAKALKASQSSPAVVEKKEKTGDTVMMPSHPKLGPKANAGAINAQLRALERDGRKCRRWYKRKMELHSFTGVAWEIPLWTGESELPT